MASFTYKHFSNEQYFEIHGHTSQLYREITGLKLVENVLIDEHVEHWGDFNVQVDRVYYATHSIKRIRREVMYIEMRIMNWFMRSMSYNDMVDLNSGLMGYMSRMHGGLDYGKPIIANIMLVPCDYASDMYKECISRLSDNEWQNGDGMISKLHDVVSSPIKAQCVNIVDVYVTDGFPYHDCRSSLKREHIEHCMHKRYHGIKNTKCVVLIHSPI